MSSTMPLNQRILYHFATRRCDNRVDWRVTCSERCWTSSAFGGERMEWKDGRRECCHGFLRVDEEERRWGRVPESWEDEGPMCWGGGVISLDSLEMAQTASQSVIHRGARMLQSTGGLLRHVVRWRVCDGNATKVYGRSKAATTLNVCHLGRCLCLSRRRKHPSVRVLGFGGAIAIDGRNADCQRVTECRIYVVPRLDLVLGQECCRPMINPVTRALMHNGKIFPL